jgi:hypothetical protein
MNIKRILLTSLLAFYFIFTFSQGTADRYAVVDWSFGFFKSTPADINRIRGSVSSYAEENSDKGLKCISFRGTTGVKYETLLLNGRIGLGTGIRYTEVVQNAGKWFLLTEGVNYFYFSYAQDEHNIYYARLKSILQTSGYLGIPAEFSFFPVASPHFCRVYMKLGAEIDFNVSTHTKIHFMNEVQPPYESQVASKISNPSLIGFTFYNSVGIRAGSEGNPTFSIEFLIPVLNSFPGSPGLLKNKFGGGLQFNYHIPILSKNQ